MKKVAIVTGSSRGIGAATAKLLAANGYAVCVTYHQSQQAAEKVVADITAKQGNAILVKTNVALEQDIIELFEQTEAEFGAVSLLVNNAGISCGRKRIENMEKKTLDEVFATNLYSAVIASREAIKQMKKLGCGNIINVSSEAAQFGGTNMSTYAMSKAAMNSFTKSLAREVAMYKIRVNAVSPGVIDTDMHANNSPDHSEALLKSIPFARRGEPAEVAQLIHWLASDAASYISGTIIPITGAR